MAKREPITMTNRDIALAIASAVLRAPVPTPRTATDAVLDTLGRLGYAFCDARDVDAVKGKP